MKGQWTGGYEGSNKGGIVVNVDELADCYEGTAYVHPEQPELPKSVAVFRTPSKRSPFVFRTTTMEVLHPDTLEIVSWDSLRGRYAPGTAMSAYADVEAEVKDGQLSLKWKTDINLTGSCILPPSMANTPSKLKSSLLNWQGFKESIGHLRPNFDLIWRGQSEPWRLRTAFHRHGRSDLRRFRLFDLPMLHKHLSARTRHYFDLNDPNQNGAFLSLAQHHGYPTHLLDWTKSPYVAAFFAYSNVTDDDIKKRPQGRVRIYLFDSGVWRAAQHYYSIESPMLHISLLEVSAVENERLIPQQAVAFITTVDDIETFVDGYNLPNRELLMAIDLPVSERDLVLDELRYMGITAGSLFPGLDGACQELKRLNFRTY